MNHRGPDGEGFFVENDIGLGHRLLRIVTFSNEGNQPLCYRGRFWLTYNGEIYNFRDLRRELEAFGHRFATETDTEVVAAAFSQWGPQCQLKFNGMWAFAIWDSYEKELVLCRDRFGIKPLFYCTEPTRFSFASELKAFLRLPGFSLSFNQQFVADDFGGLTCADAVADTLIHGVQRLLPGHYLVLGNGKRPAIHRWWNTLHHLESVSSGFDNQVEQFRELFTDACRIAANMGSQFGSNLSGGLDSSSMLFTLNELASPFYSRQAFHSFFPDGDTDERPFALEGAKKTGVELEINVVGGSEALRDMNKAIFFAEGLKGCPSARWLTYQRVHDKGLKVLLEGEGADELLAGYEHYSMYGIRSALMPIPRMKRIGELQNIHSDLVGCRNPNSVYPAVRRAMKIELHERLGALHLGVYHGLETIPWMQKGWGQIHRQLRPKGNLLGLLKTYPRSFQYPALEEDQKLLRSLTPLNRKLYIDFHYGVLPGILSSVDRCSMAHGVEVRCPFLDWRLVCFAFSLPDESKMGGGLSKRILRAAMQSRVPRSLVDRRKKTPFRTPIGSWIAGPAKEYLMSGLNDRAFLESEIWEGDTIRRLVETSLKAKNYKSAALGWSFVQSSRLMQLFKEDWQQWQL